MNSTLKTFVIILITAGVVGFSTYAYINRNVEVPISETEEVEEVATGTTKNLIKNVEPNFQFELPEGYGAFKEQIGEGGINITYNIGKVAPDIGENVLEGNLFLGNSVRVWIPNDPGMDTLAEWQSPEGVGELSEVLESSEITVAGVPATKTRHGGFSEFHVIRFVKDKNLYEIRYYGLDDVMSHIIETFSFTE